MVHDPSPPSSRIASHLRGLADALQGADEPSSTSRPAQRLAEQLAAHLDLDAALRCALAHMAREAQADRALVVLRDAQGSLVACFGWGLDGDPLACLPHAAAVLDQAIAERRSLASPVGGAVTQGAIAAAVPLGSDAEGSGGMYFERQAGRAPFRRQDLERLEGLAAVTTLAVRHARHHQANAARLNKQRLINEVSLAINATVDIEKLLSLILQHALRLTGGEQGYILVGSSDAPRCLASRGSDGQPLEALEISRSVVARCLDDQHAVCILDTHEDLTSRTDSVLDLDLRSVMCVRLEANQQPLGVLYLSSRAITKTFTAEDRSLLEAIANQAALAIHHAKLVEEQDRQIADLERTLQMLQEAQARAITDGLTGIYNHAYFKEVLGNAVQESQRYGHALSLILVDLDHFKLVNDTHGHQAGDEVLRRVAATIRQMVRDCDVLARYGGEELAILLTQTDLSGASVLAERIRTAVADLSITTLDGTPLAVTASLGVAAHRPGVSATQLVEQADKALYLAKHGGRNRACTHEQVVDVPQAQRGREVQRSAFMAMVTAMSAFENARDQVTDERAAMTLELALRLGSALGLAPYQLAELEQAVAIYDVGKCGVPEQVLQKTTPLDPDELELVRTHPIQGAKLLVAGNLPGVAKTIRHHHEHWDGTGYPDRMKGEEIPLPARILAVVDAYGAIVTDRPYRKALGPAHAVSELRRGAGRQFDPAVVEAFLEILAQEPPGAP